MDSTTAESAGTLQPSLTPIATEDKESSARMRANGSICLPDNPVVSIRPSASWIALDLKSVWAYRELLYFLTWRDVKIRYKQTVLGAAWAILQPVMMTIIFTLFFGTLAGVKSDDIPYPIFAFAGLLPWTFFSNSVSNSGNSLVGSSSLITKIYFPRMIIPGAAVCAGLVDLAIAFGVMIPMMIYYRVPLSLHLLMLPVVTIMTTVLALGVGMWMSALNVKYRDVRFALPFMIQLWMFASPVIYPLTNVPRRYQWILALNPMTGIIQGFRSSLLGQPFHWSALIFSAVITVATLIYAAYFFRHMEKSFADIV